MGIGSLASRGIIRRICLVKGSSIKVVVIREDVKSSGEVKIRSDGKDSRG